jgi:hypothetical protein
MEKGVENMKNKKVPELLKEKADLFEAKSKEYGNSYLQYGKVMKEIFPNGFNCNNVDEWNKFGIFSMMVHKLLRTANTNFKSIDSIKDMQVYGAILEEIVNEID